MIDIRDIRSLSDFQRRAKSHIQRLRKTGQPSVLTVNGRASVVVQDAQSYQLLLDAVEQAATLSAVRQGLREANRGQTIPLDAFDAEMRRKHKLSPRKRP